MGDKIVLATILFFLTLSSASALDINEFVVDPQTDWDSSGSATSGDEWVELYNSANTTLDLTNWSLLMIDNGNDTEVLSGSIAPFGYKVIYPAGTQNNDGQIRLYDAAGILIDSVSYGTYNDTNISDNAPTGNADALENECLARMPNGVDTDTDSEDFIQTKCTFGAENGALLPNEQGLNATILGKIVLAILPRLLEFGPVQPGSTDNPALNGPITLDATGSSADVTVEITDVMGAPFNTGLKIDDAPAIGKSWTILQDDQVVEATPTLDVPEDTPAGPAQGTIIYTITGPTP